MCSPGREPWGHKTPVRSPPPCAAVNGGGTRRREIRGADDPRVDTLGYTHDAPLGLLRLFIKVVM